MVIEIVLLLVSLLWFLLIARIAIMDTIAQKIGDDADGTLYKLLPNHDNMVCNPRHWNKWTKKQWLRYVYKRR